MDSKSKSTASKRSILSNFWPWKWAGQRFLRINKMAQYRRLCLIYTSKMHRIILDTWQCLGTPDSSTQMQKRGCRNSISKMHSAPWITGEGHRPLKLTKCDRMSNVVVDESISVIEASWDKKSRKDILATSKDTLLPVAQIRTTEDQNLGKNVTNTVMFFCEHQNR